MTDTEIMADDKLVPDDQIEIDPVAQAEYDNDPELQRVLHEAMTRPHRTVPRRLRPSQR